jgi:hypothetical protein
MAIPFSAGAAGVNGVQFVPDHRHGFAVVKAQRAGAGGWCNVLSCGQHMQDTVQRDTQFICDDAGGYEAWGGFRSAHGFSFQVGT